MHMKITMMRKALATPGIALPSETMILLSDLIRLNSRKTRNARSSRSRLPGPMSTRASEIVPTATTMKSKMFHPDFQNGTKKEP